MMLTQNLLGECLEWAILIIANSELKAESTGYLFKELSLDGGRNMLYCEVTEGWGRRQIFINEGDLTIFIINKGWSRYSERLANSFREDSIDLLFDKSTDGTMGSKWVTRMCGNEKFGTIAYEDRQKATQWVKELYKNLAVKGSLFLKEVIPRYLGAHIGASNGTEFSNEEIQTLLDKAKSHRNYN